MHHCMDGMRLSPIRSNGACRYLVVTMRTTPLLLLLAVVACAPISPTEARLRFDDEAVVAGVVGFPKGGPPGSCDRLTLEAIADDGQPVGHLAVHASKRRCLYTLDGLPPG